MENGLQNNTVLSLFEDMDKSLWLGLDNGIGHIVLNSPYLIYDDIIGDIGSVYSYISFNDMIYIGTNQGLFYKSKSSMSGFEFIPGTQGQVWQLEEINGILFCCHHNGTFIIEDKKAKKIEGTEGTWNLRPIKNSDNLMIQGSYDGLYVLEKRGDIWQLRNKIDGFENSSRFVELFDEFIFVNHEYKGLYKISVDDAFRAVKSVQIDTVLWGDNSAILSSGDELLYAHQKGIHIYDGVSGRFLKDSLLSSLYTEANYTSGKMTAIGDEIWFFTKDNLSMVSKSSLNNKRVITKIELGESSRNSISGYENMAQLKNVGNYVLGTGSGYILLDTKKIREKRFNIEIAEIKMTTTNSPDNAGQLLATDKMGDFEHYKNNITLSFYTPEYGKYTHPRYQYRLHGIYQNWSEWSSSHSVQFNNLPYGDYTFEVRSKIGEQISENTASFTFKIQKKWYQSNLAIALYAFIGILGLFFMHMAYRRHYRQRQEKLLEKSEKEMRIAKAENEKEIVRLKNEQLKQRVRLKSNELAASTMSLLRKNEVLNEVKNLLDNKVKDPGIKGPITKIIDESLTKNDDWELFKEAFNNADKDFLGKLNKSHPNLTQNDIRLCAYLRLNLSSKEIGPLFNISTKSVEIKRYRLRKKMGLEHDKNLVDYILNL
ncbi:triple tyrosine motif-containing protein [Maribacter sp. 4G9]|uniref:helix-turn-helix and ligand-binding sensor domain-containing protein n=1 Tax=Maribacter sp. 4G9 TaxID=1889777 RepID=UPI000C14809A|nr:triple tyrosine motif-containing protein [Maribacter sp. 4G9]